MRNTKIVSAFVALVLAISLAGLVASPAQATKPKHNLTASGGGTSGHLYIGGQTTTGAGKKVIIKKKRKGTSQFAFYKDKVTNNKGKFKINVNGGIGDCFSVTVPASRGYKAKTLKGRRFCIVKVG